MLTKSVFAVGCLTVVATLALYTPAVSSGSQGATGIGLLNCDIDLRRDDRNEAQVFWKSGTAADGYGFKYEIWDRHSDVIQAGNAIAENELKMKAGGPNTAVFTYNKGANTVTLVITDKEGKVQEYKDMEPVGTFNPIGPVVDPVMTEARRDSGQKRRFVVTAGNYGLTYEFTISDV